METTVTIGSLKAEKQRKLDEVITNAGVFFAFSDKQFQENKTPLMENEKYVSIGAGGYVPKSKLDQFINGCESVNKWYKAQIKQTKQLRYDNIAYELANHEAYYTCDIADTLQALGSGYTYAEVLKVYKAEKAKSSNQRVA